MTTSRPARILAVHAHPDDESVWTGLALTRWAREGADVHVLTCTLGEEGEVIGEKYRSLMTDKSGLLGGYRVAELQRALGCLGVNRDPGIGESRPHLLGGVGAWRDSGMAGTPTIERAEAFAGGVPNDERFQLQTAQLKEEINRLRPDVIVTYGPDGGYGHPDHIRAHQITHAAVTQMQGEGLSAPAAILWAVTERQKVFAALDNVEPPEGWRMPQEEDIAAVDSSDVDVRVRGESEDVAAKAAAMVAHATQLWVSNGSVTDVNPAPRVSGPGEPTLWALSNLFAQPLLDTESYRIGWLNPVREASRDVVNGLPGVATNELR